MRNDLERNKRTVTAFYDLMFNQFFGPFWWNELAHIS